MQLKKMIVDMQIRGLFERSQDKYLKYAKGLKKQVGKPVAEVTENEI